MLSGVRVGGAATAVWSVEGHTGPRLDSTNQRILCPLLTDSLSAQRTVHDTELGFRDYSALAFFAAACVMPWSVVSDKACVARSRQRAEMVTAEPSLRRAVGSVNHDFTVT